MKTITKKYKVGGKMLTKQEWISKVAEDLESQLEYTDDLWQSDNYGTGKGFRVYYKLAIATE